MSSHSFSRRVRAGLLIAGLILLLATLTAQAQGETPALIKSSSWALDWPVAAQAEKDSSLTLPLISAPVPLDWHILVYQAYVNNNWELAIANSSGSPAYLLTSNTAVDALPRLNRDATQVVFVSGRDGNLELYRLDLTTLETFRLTNDESEDTAPAWSPDGSKIAFTSRRDGLRNLYVMNADGSGVTRLTQDSHADEQADWSPDGSQLAWIKCANTCALWVMNADGSNPHQILGGYSYLQDPRWSPDGKRIAFDADLDFDYWNEVGIFNLENSTVQILTQPPSNSDHWMGAWSSDGQWLAYSQVNYIVIENQLYIQSASLKKIRAAGSNNSDLPSPASVAIYPDWRLADLAAPSTSPALLPAYSRAAGVPVTWSSVDAGPAGVDNVQIQYRRSAQEPWMDWLQNFYRNTAVYTGTPGESVSFRVRAQDKAGNLEDWNHLETGFSRLYSSQLHGSLRDNRGLPLAFAPLTISPAPFDPVQVNAGGQYQAYLVDAGTHTLAADLPGYALLNESLQFTRDTTRYDYLRPTDDQLNNGGFEDGGLDGWRVSGGLPVTVTQAAHSGELAVGLGALCPEFVCLGEPVKLAYAIDKTQVILDSKGTLHALLLGNPGGYYSDNLLYTSKAPGQDWEPIREIYDLPYNLSSTHGLEMAFGPDGALHVVWDHCYGCTRYSVFYAQRSPDGVWQPLVEFEGGTADFGIDRQGVLHLIYQSHGGIGTYYRQRLPDGAWTEPYFFALSTGVSNALVVAPDDSVHVIWAGNGYLGKVAYYQSRLPGGEWSAPLALNPAGKEALRNINMVMDRQGRLHAVLSGLYIQDDLNGNWTSPVEILNYFPEIDPPMVFDPQGRLYILGAGGGNFSYLQAQNMDGSWAMQRLEVVGTDGLIAFLIDPLGTYHLVYTSFWSAYYLTAPVAHQMERAAIQRSQTISATLHQPTLAFSYRLNGGRQASAARLEVSVSSPLTRTLVYSSSNSLEWTQGWTDLSRWSGEVVTITFALRQPVSETLATLWLDDISFGSWLTPRVLDTNLYHITTPVSQTLIIRGENFLPGARVRLGSELELAGVEWLDEQTLRVSLPPIDWIGPLDLWVINPGGQAGVRPGALRFGQVVYLPIARR